MMRLLFFLTLSLGACNGSQAAGPPGLESETLEAQAVQKGQAAAVFAGGCFWCMEAPFDKLEGVISTTSGYTGGTSKGPSYTQVSSGLTSHIEAIRIVYDPKRIDYATLLDTFWHNIDPTQDNGQFCDLGPHYRSAIFTSEPGQVRLAQASRSTVAATLGAEVVTVIRDEAPFWVAEDYHQNFYTVNPAHYQRYRTGCGRDRRLQELWGPDATRHRER